MSGSAELGGGWKSLPCRRCLFSDTVHIRSGFPGAPDTEREMNTRDAILAAPSRVQEPIRAEVFGIERLRQHAEGLAAAQPIADERARGRRLLPRVQQNGKVLLAGYRDIVEAVRQKSQITQAEEWLLDNFHVLDGQIREIRDHLPQGFYRVLPKIAEGLPPRRVPTSLWAGMGLCGAYGQSIRHGDATGIRWGLPARPAARHR